MFVFIFAQDILTLLPLKSVPEQPLLTVRELVTIKKKKRQTQQTKYKSQFLSDHNLGTSFLLTKY